MNIGKELDKLTDKQTRVCLDYLFGMISNNNEFVGILEEAIKMTKK